MMNFKASFVLLLSALALILTSNATESPAELYWKTKLGNIPMPKALKYSLQLDAEDGKANYAAHPADQVARVGKVNNARPTDPDAREALVTYARPFELDAEGGKVNDARPTDPDAREALVTYARPFELDSKGGKVNDARPTDPDAREALVTYARPFELDAEGDKVNNARPTDPDAREALVTYARPFDLEAEGGKANNNARPETPVSNHYKFTEPQDGRVIYFKYEKLFQPGTKMVLHFRKIDDGVKFLPLDVAKSIAIAPNKLQTILNILSVNPKSTTAQYIKDTINDCKEKGIKDEVRFCATSVESMVDNIAMDLGSEKNKIKAVSTEQDEDILMEFKIQKADKLAKDDDHTTVCHKLENPYAVFLCHNVINTEVYGVSLVGANGKQVKAISVCHKDTTDWNPKHLALQLLNLKPGSKPICHFLSGDAIVWLRN